MPLTPEEQQELAQLEAQYASKAQPKKSKLTPMEEKELAELEAKYTPQEQSLGAKALDYSMRGLDYGGGLVRTGIANVAGLAAGKGNIVTEEDLKNMAVGKAPTSAQYMERAGVPEGPSINFTKATAGMLPFGKISARDVGGFVGDVATDPLTAVTKGVKALRPGSTLAEKGGEKLFKSGLKNVDKDLLEKGKAPVSDILFERGKAGSMKSLKGEAEKAADEFMVQRDRLYQAANDAGAVVDMSAVVKNAEKEIAKLKANPGTRDIAEKLTDYLNKYKGEGFVDIQSASDWKTALYDSLPASAFGPDGRIKGVTKNFEKALARDFKTAIEKAADEVAPGMGKQISQLNEKTGSVLSSKKSFNREIKKAETPNSVTQVDMMTMGMGGILGAGAGGTAGGVVGSTVPLVLKQGAKVMNTTGGRTRSGLLLNNIGKSGLIDATARRGLIDRNR